MGFECSITKLPKFGNVSAEQAATAYAYAGFLKWTKTEPWCLDMISKGHKFSLSDWDSRFSEEGLPPQEIIEKYEKYFNERSEGNEMGTWCSVGRCFDEEIVKYGKDVGKNCIFVMEKDKVAEYVKKIGEWLHVHRFVPVEPVNGVKLIKDDDGEENGIVQLIPVDGIEVVDDNGGLRRYTTHEDCYCGLYARATDCDDDEYWAYESLHSVLVDALTTDFDDYYIFYERSF